MDRFAAMALFVRVVDTGSFTRAAESLGVSRATVSVSIQQLEEHLGVRLLHRTTRSVSLTSEGRLYHDKARDVLTRLETAEQLFHTSRRKVTGRLSIDAPTRIARRVLIPALPELLAQHPSLELHLGASDRSINLVEKGVDAVIRVGTLRDSAHISRPLGSLAQVNCASPDYLARYGHPTSPGALDQHFAVGYAPTVRSTTTWDFVENGVEQTRVMRSRVTVDNAETYIAAGLAGLGLLQVPAYDVRHHLDSGALVAVLPRFLPSPLPISLVYPSRKQVPARLQAFAEWAQEVFQRHGMLDATPPIARNRAAIASRR